MSAGVAARIGYRVAFAIGVGALGISLAVGFVHSLWQGGRPPGLLVDPLVEAQREFAGRDPERFIHEARSLTEIQPRNQGAYLALGRGLSGADRVDEAIGAYEAAIALGGVPPLAHAQLARLYYQRGDLDAARAQGRLAQSGGVSFSEAFLRAVGLEAGRGGDG